MDADYDIFEIVVVIHDFWLVDAESYQREYCTNQAQPLARGYYVVNWPDSIQSRQFNEQAIFHGPFTLRKEAQAICDSLHQERDRILTMPSEKSFVCTRNSSRPANKKFASQRQSPVKGAKSKPVDGGWNSRIIESTLTD